MYDSQLKYHNLYKNKKHFEFDKMKNYKFYFPHNNINEVLKAMKLMRMKALS